MKIELVHSIFSCTHPKFSYALMVQAPVDTSKVSVKPWTNLVADVFMKNDNLMDIVMSQVPKKRETVYDLAKKVRNTLTAYTRKRHLLPGLLKKAPTTTVLKPQMKRKLVQDESEDEVEFNLRKVYELRKRQRKEMKKPRTKTGEYTYTDIYICTYMYRNIYIHIYTYAKDTFIASSYYS